jgi:DnaK suppressor protein
MNSFTKKSPQKKPSTVLSSHLPSLEQLEKALLSERARIVEMLEQTQSASKLDDADTRADEVDVTNDLATAETYYAVSENLEKKLHEIENAIRRLSSGDYGLCRECEEQIPVKRLIAMPSAEFCIQCQAESERGRLSA